MGGLMGEFSPHLTIASSNNAKEAKTMQLNLPQTLSTEEVASLAKLRPQSIRASLCRTGHWLGLRPVKLANRRLVWSAADVARILGGGA